MNERPRFVHPSREGLDYSLQMQMREAEQSGSWDQYQYNAAQNQSAEAREVVLCDVPLLFVRGLPVRALRQSK